MTREFKAVIMLFITSIIWGLAFVAQTEGMELIGPFTFTAARSYVAVVFLILTFLFFNKKMIIEDYSKEKTIRGGMICGIVFTISINLQQIGLLHTTAGKASFLTALYIVVIPIISLFLGKKIPPKIIICIVIAIIGTYLLSVKESFDINLGDITVILSAIAFAVHMMLLSKYSTGTNAILVSLIQFLMCAVISNVIALLIEDFELINILKSYVTILYVGILSSGVGFTIQLIALKDLDTVIASMISSLESVFGALFGWIILGQAMDLREIAGASLIFIATLLAQIPIEKYFTIHSEKF
ncbi:DMT family transporter [Peptoniphilus sp. MSJ-1]|uniref:DMT family transporter n=1 Tax=Peptoniphilus ovalis TaxID=2841503 RepID=A0ABS6FI15_9FIRM|nr:DMT family transporter [Peptoniphilus ovalis]MBU5669815.1 DMT family transporter [Peptoniphilus ovalis]